MPASEQIVFTLQCEHHPDQTAQVDEAGLQQAAGRGWWWSFSLGLAYCPICSERFSRYVFQPRPDGTTTLRN